MPHEKSFVHGCPVMSSNIRTTVKPINSLERNGKPAPMSIRNQQVISKMRTSVARANNYCCPVCDVETTVDEEGRGWVRHMRPTKCKYGRGQRDEPPGGSEPPKTPQSKSPPMQSTPLPPNWIDRFRKKQALIA